MKKLIIRGGVGVVLIMIFAAWTTVVKHTPIIKGIETTKKEIALTFDACESKKAAYFDSSIVNYMTKNKIPFTIFLGGKFAMRNAKEVRALSKLPFIEFENHSMNHHNHMDRMSDAQVISEVNQAEKVIYKLTGRKPEYFRFPAGNCNQRTINDVENQGLKIVHWTYASGDPDKEITPIMLENEVDEMTKPGNILIFHINGRGYSTGAALPEIVDYLKKKGYSFVTVDQLLHKG